MGDPSGLGTLLTKRLAERRCAVRAAAAGRTYLDAAVGSRLATAAGYESGERPRTAGAFAREARAAWWADVSAAHLAPRLARRVADRHRQGTLRELGYKDRVGERTAHQLSTGSAIALFAAYFELLARPRPLTSARKARQVGFIWLALTVAFEFGFGRGVAHTSWNELLADYDLRRGRLWPVVLA